MKLTRLLAYSRAWILRATAAFALALYAIAVASGAAPSTAASSSPTEAERALERRVKAAFLYRFTEFVTWPEAAFARADSPFTIVVIGREAHVEELRQTTAGRTVQGRPVEVRRLVEGEAIGSRFPRSPPGCAGRAAEAKPVAAPTAQGAAAGRVLVADDNHDFATSLALILRDLGNDVRVAHDGQGGLRAAETFQPAVAFLDIGLPGLDGYELARRLRARHGGNPLLLVAVTGWGQESDKLRAARPDSTTAWGNHWIPVVRRRSCEPPTETPRLPRRLKKTPMAATVRIRRGHGPCNLSDKRP